MLMDILISDAYIPVPGGFTKGYVYINEGKIMEIGEGEPPEDLKLSQLSYPVSGGVVLRGLSSPYTDLSLYWARGLIGKKISYIEALRLTSNLDVETQLSLIAVALRELLLRGFTFFGIRLVSPEIAKYLEEELGIHGVWLSTKEFIFDSKWKVISISENEDERPYIRITDKGVTNITWSDGSKSICTDKDEPREIDSLCLELSLMLEFPLTRETYSQLDASQMHKLTSSNAYRQLLGETVDFSLNKNDYANIVVIRPDYPPATGLSPDEIAYLFYTGRLNAPTIDTVVSNGNILVDKGEVLGINERLLMIGHKKTLELRKTLTQS
jgi:hypothetical protein